MQALANELQDPAPTSPPTAAAQDYSSLQLMEENTAPSPALIAVEKATPSPDPASDTIAPEIAHIRDQLRTIRAKAQKAGLLPAAETSTTPKTDDVVVSSTVKEQPVEKHAVAHFLPLDGQMSERLHGFALWVARLVANEEMLLIDDNGDLLWGSPSRSDLAMSALLSVSSSLRSTAEGVCKPPEIIRSKLSGNKELSVLPCHTRFGLVTLALVNTDGIPEETVGWLREALVLAVEGRTADERGSAK